MICTHYSIGMAKSSMSSSLVIAGWFRFYQFTQFYFLGFKFIFRVFGFIWVFTLWIIFISFRTGESRGFAFVRYKYQDEAAKAVEKLDGFILSFFLRVSYFNY